MSSYTRNTELRNVHTKDLYNLAVILDNDNYWQILMEVIPQNINNETFGTKEDLEKISSGAAYDRKYSNDQIRLIENAIRRPGESRLYSQILFDEWGSSGRKNERPTLGVLLHLLIQSKLYRAADFVAELLNETKPSRPTNGPAAEFEFEVDVFKDIQETVNDTRFYPNTEELQENANNDINIDYYSKYKQIDKKITLENDNTDDPVMNRPPKPPPRLSKAARLLKQQRKQLLQQQELNQLLAQTANGNSTNNEINQQHFNIESNNESMPLGSLTSKNNVPKLSALMHNENSNTTHSMLPESVLPNLSAFNNRSQAFGGEDIDYSLSSTSSLIYTKPNIAETHEQHHKDLNSIQLQVLSQSLYTDSKKQGLDLEINDLPVISALNLNGERSGDDEQPQNSNFECDSSIDNRTSSFNISAVTDDDFNIPCVIANINFNQNLSRHQLEAVTEDYSGAERADDLDTEADEENDEDSIPNLSFLENRSSNNESSLTSVTNTSGENSFEQSVNDCSSTSTDNLPYLSVFHPNNE